MDATTGEVAPERAPAPLEDGEGGAGVDADIPVADPAGGCAPRSNPADTGVAAPLWVVRRAPLQVANELRLALARDNVTLLAAGVATFWMIALVPSIAALVSLYGLFADPEQVEQQVRDVTEAMPAEVSDLLVAQFSAIVDTDPSGLGATAAIGFLIAVFSTSAGVKQLMRAINVAYEFEETRGYVALRARAMALTFGLLALAVIVIGTIAVLPPLLSELGVGDASRAIVELVRWPLLGLAVMFSLSVFYQVAPNRTWSTWRWVTPGAVVATLVWLTGSVAFSIYTANFGNYNETYGALSTVVVMLLWFMLSATAVIIGAEVNAELERESDAPGTLGPRRPTT